MLATSSMSIDGRALRASGTRVPCAAPLRVPRRTLSRPAHFMEGERDPQGDPIVVYTSTDPAHGGLSTFSQSVLMALLEKRLPFREVRVDLGRKSPEFTDLYHSVMPGERRKVRAPLLVDGPTLLVETPVIVDYLQRAYNSGTQLLPSDNAAAEAKIQLFMHYFNQYVVPPYEKLLHVTNELSINDAREELMEALECLDAFINVHGHGAADYALGPHFGWSMHSGRPSKLRSEGYFLGPFYSVAEVATTPYVNRMVQLLPEWRGVNVFEEASQRRLNRLVMWMEASLERPSAKMTDVPAEDLVNGMIDREWNKM